MRRIAFLALILLATLTASARSIHYFTYTQAARTVSYLNAQNEIMIYCGYDYEIETYVLLNEVWMERVNSAYYELWVFGYDAYTGDEIYMPLDLQCVWLFSGGRIYNAAQYLRFRVDVHYPSIVWHIPPYNPYTRIVHRPGYSRSYHYDIHRYGWMPHAYTYGPGVPPPPLPPYYMRQPNTPAPAPVSSWTPGVNRPSVNTGSTISQRTRDNNPSTGTVVNSSHNSTPVSNRTNLRGNSSNNNTASGSRSNSTATSSSNRTTSARTNTATGTSNTRGTTPNRSSLSNRTASGTADAPVRTTSSGRTVNSRTSENAAGSNTSTSRSSTTSTSRTTATTNRTNTSTSSTRTSSTRNSTTSSNRTRNNR